MNRALCIAILLSLAAAAQADDKKASAPDDGKAEAVLILQGNNTKLVGKPRFSQVEEGGQQVQKPDLWVPGNVIIIRELDDQTAKHLKVRNGAAEAGAAYRIREKHELEYVGKVDLKKSNQALAKQFGVKAEKRPKSSR